MKLRYVELPPKRIFNWLDPFNVTAKWGCDAIEGDWWSEKNVGIRRYFADEWTKEFDNITGHFTDLEKSIQEKGILTPISCDSGGPRGSFLKPHHFPPRMQNNLKEAIHTNPFGGSRLTIAEKLGIESVPCVVHDYADLFPDEPEVTKHNFKDWFGDDYAFAPCAPFLRIRWMLHITDKKYNGMNGNTRKAQQAAAIAANGKTYAKYNLKDPAEEE